MTKTVLAAASFYSQKYFYESKFNGLPKDVKDELQILCVSSAEKIRGIFIIGFNNDSTIYIETQREPNDFDYDEINADLACSEILKEKEELLKSLCVWHGYMREER